MSTCLRVAFVRGHIISTRYRFEISEIAAPFFLHTLIMATHVSLFFRLDYGESCRATSGLRRCNPEGSRKPKDRCSLENNRRLRPSAESCWRKGLMPARVLLVDDRQEVVNLMQKTVGVLQWCELRTLSDGSEAAVRLVTEKFDGIIVGNELPQMNGFDLTRSIRQSSLNAETPVVMLTQDNDVETMRRGFKAGVTLFLTRPANRERAYALLNAMRGIMSSGRRRYARMPYRTNVICELESQPGLRFAAESVEIGEGGICLSPADGVEVGQELILELALPQVDTPPRKVLTGLPFQPSSPGQAVTRLHTVHAVVRYKRPPNSIGLEFTSIPPECRELIQQYVSGTGD